MRSQIGLVNPALRTKHVGYIVPKKVYRQKGGFLPLLFLPSLVGGLGAASVASSMSRKQGGSGVIEDADKIYQQTLLGNGLRLAGQGVNLAGQGIGVAGGAINLAGHGIGVAGGSLGDLPAGMLRMSLLDNQVKQSVDRNYDNDYAVGSGKHKMKGRGQDSLGHVQDALYDVVSAGLHKMGVGNLIPDTLVKSVIKSATKKA
jgi:hypothetical protein